QSGFAVEQDRIGVRIVHDGQKPVDCLGAVDADVRAPNEVRPDEDVADAELPAQVAFFDRAAVEVAQFEIGIGEIVLKVDDSLDSQLREGFLESIRRKLAAAINQAGNDLA